MTQANLTNALAKVESDLSGWALLCVQSLERNASGVAQDNFGFVGQDGSYMPTFDPENTWGINYTACQAFCNTEQTSYPDFDFTTFANSFTNWLLPWLALLAQLPYQTSTPWGDLMSLFLFLGSPALGVYSLCLTMLDRYNARAAMRDLRDDLASSDLVLRRWSDVRQHLRNITHFLVEAHQVPIRLSQREGWLSSLLVCAENHSWWQRVYEELNRSRRSWTYSFWAQTIAAILTWAFTVGGAVEAALGNEQTALILSASTLWIWMLPLVAGWFVVGTQGRSDSVDDALRLSGSRRALEQSEDGRYTEKMPQTGIIVRSGLAPQLLPQRAQTSRSFSVTAERSVPLWFGFSILGDEAERGPIYNYARIFTWNQVAETITSSLRKTLKNVYKGRPCSVGIGQDVYRAQLNMEDSEIIPGGGHSYYGETSSSVNDAPGFMGGGSLGGMASASSAAIPMVNNPRRRGERRQKTSEGPMWNEEAALKENFAGDAYHTALYCGLEPHEPRADRKRRTEMKAYTPWKDMSYEIRNSIVVASLISLLVQWGSTGSSITIAYNTPTAGMGCRSGGYLIYGVSATIAWLLLMLSCFLSHSAMLHFQQLENPEDFAVSLDSSSGASHQTAAQSTSVTRDPNSRQARMYRSTLCGLAVSTRLAGKTLAVLNGLWLLVSSFFEIVGVYDNCWCESVFVTRGMAGWVTIFRTNAELVSATKSYWAGGIVMSSFASIIAFAFFALGGIGSSWEGD